MGEMGRRRQTKTQLIKLPHVISLPHRREGWGEGERERQKREKEKRVMVTAMKRGTSECFRDYMHVCVMRLNPIT